MNQEDLLDIIDYDESIEAYESLAEALRAVVQLHKPEQRCYDATCYCKDMCSKCKEDYPCSEIQVIEKALL